MFDFLKDNTFDQEKSENSLKEVACLLIHASKIDQSYTDKEKNIIKKTLIDLGAEKVNLDKIISEAEIIESDSNQILDFTRNLKNVERNIKLIIVESLWKIIFSDNDPDMFETNLMRRLTGLLYLNPKEVGDIKEKVKNKL